MAEQWKDFEVPSAIKDGGAMTDWTNALSQIKALCGDPAMLDELDEKNLQGLLDDTKAPRLLRSKIEKHWRSLKGIAQSGGAVSSTDPEMKELLAKVNTTMLEQAELLAHFKETTTRTLSRIFPRVGSVPSNSIS
eukprot:TRINITY_DN9915_c0_g1_i1.p1 TRINITY_DN9915_c0_g1~~TRINITY_DN9915_c0_g1_i1.p1  ORF type:complete len:152 (-),score=34.01 TRINITY_DN9915_c0_g1_i1:283-687(-)